MTVYLLYRTLLFYLLFCLLFDLLLYFLRRDDYKHIVLGTGKLTSIFFASGFRLATSLTFFSSSLTNTVLNVFDSYDMYREIKRHLLVLTFFSSFFSTFFFSTFFSSFFSTFSSFFSSIFSSYNATSISFVEELTRKK